MSIGPFGCFRPIGVAERLSISPDCHIKGCHRYRKQLYGNNKLQESGPILPFSFPLTLLIQQRLCVTVCITSVHSIDHHPSPLTNYSWHSICEINLKLCRPFCLADLLLWQKKPHHHCRLLSLCPSINSGILCFWICQPLGSLLSVKMSSDLCQTS